MLLHTCPRNGLFLSIPDPPILVGSFNGLGLPSEVFQLPLHGSDTLNSFTYLVASAGASTDVTLDRLTISMVLVKDCTRSAAATACRRTICAMISCRSFKSPIQIPRMPAWCRAGRVANSS